MMVEPFDGVHAPSGASTALRVLHPPAWEQLRRLTELAATLFGGAAAGIGFRDNGGTWQQISSAGAPQLPEDLVRACQVTEPLLVLDAASDPAWREHWVVAGAPGVRFCAGCALRAEDGSAIGAIWVIGSQPKAPDGARVERLKELAALAEQQLGLQVLVEDNRRLRASERRYRALFEPNPDAVYTIDPSGRFTSCNEAVARLTGYPYEALRGQSFRPMIAPDDAARVDEHFQRCLAGEPVYLQVRMVRWDGSDLYASISAAPYVIEGELKGVMGITRDVSAQVMAEQRLHRLQRQLSYQASHDALTALYNRNKFERRLAQAQRAASVGAQRHVMCYIDLDRFHIVNDTAGHAAGDALLRQLGEALSQGVRSPDVLARLGGDEFGLLLIERDVEEAERIARAIIGRVESLHFLWEGRVYNISASVGMALIDGRAEGIAEIMSQADIACYAAKAAGRGRVSIYRPEHSDALRHHREVLVASGIRDALREDRFCLYAQPIVPTADSEQAGPHYELLVRMLDSHGGLIPPNVFIPAAERYDLMSQVDRWVLREALQRQGASISAIPGFAVSVNLSAHSLNDPAFLAFARDLLSESPVAARQVRFEVTETAAVMQLESAGEVLEGLRKLGCGIALDDFGAGLASFNYLKHFAVDYIKIDGSFIRDLCSSKTDALIVETIHGIARKFGTRTIAEFVESDAILTRLREIGVDYAQGYGIGRPRPLGAVLAEEARNFGVL